MRRPPTLDTAAEMVPTQSVHSHGGCLMHATSPHAAPRPILSPPAAPARCSPGDCRFVTGRLSCGSAPCPAAAALRHTVPGPVRCLQCAVRASAGRQRLRLLPPCVPAARRYKSSSSASTAVRAGKIFPGGARSRGQDVSSTAGAGAGEGSHGGEGRSRAHEGRSEDGAVHGWRDRRAVRARSFCPVESRQKAVRVRGRESERTSFFVGDVVF